MSTEVYIVTEVDDIEREERVVAVFRSRENAEQYVARCHQEDADDRMEFGRRRSRHFEWEAWPLRDVVSEEGDE